MSCTYRGRNVIGEGMGSEKRIAVHLACDDVIRKIRKIKTRLNGVVTLQEMAFSIPEEPRTRQTYEKDLYDQKVHITDKDLPVEKMSTEAAIDRLQGEGLTFFVYLNDYDAVCLVTRNANGGFTNFEVC